MDSKESLKQELLETYDKVWNTEEMTKEFEVDGFLAPYVVVKRRSDGVKGTLEFTHMPRFYFDFQSMGE